MAAASANTDTTATFSSNATTSVTAGAPIVRVPVLSKATAVTDPICSRCTPPLMSTPRLVALEIALTIAIGVDTTSAHGQLTTRSVRPR